jgi:hypothetical protein
VYINDTTGRGARDLGLAKEAFESIGYQVIECEWNGNSFPVTMPQGGPAKKFP